MSLPTKRISVESLDSLAELRGVKHSGSFSVRWDAAERKVKVKGCQHCCQYIKSVHMFKKCQNTEYLDKCES